VKRVLLLVIALLVGLLGPVPTASAVPASPLGITGAANFRDLAGDGTIALAGGGHLATGVVYRSAKLYDLTAADISALEAAGISDVYDLRTKSVAKKLPDPKITGADNHLIDLFAGHTLSSAKATTPAKARAYMREEYRRFVTISDQRKALSRTLRSIVKAEGPVIIHCTQGKDRTGWVSAMLQTIAGVDSATITDQFLLSNTYRAADIAAKVEATRAKYGDTRAAAVSEKETLRASYLQAGLDKAKSKYGSVKKYLLKGVGLSNAQYAALRTLLTAP